MIGAWVAIGVTAVLGGLLSWVDVREHRLPNRLVAVLTVAVALSLVAASAQTGDWAALLRALLGGLALAGLYLAVAIISPASMGMGDVKLAFPLGMLVAWFSWTAWLWALFGSFVLGGLAAVSLLLLRRTGLKQQLAFGPAMVLAALVMAVLAATVRFE